MRLDYQWNTHSKDLIYIQDRFSYGDARYHNHHTDPRNYYWGSPIFSTHHDFTRYDQRNPRFGTWCVVIAGASITSTYLNQTAPRGKSSKTWMAICPDRKSKRVVSPILTPSSFERMTRSDYSLRRSAGR